MGPAPNQLLLHYRILEKIGEGGMGAVWKAVDTTLDREVAIKVLPEPFALDADRLARFEREAKILASLNHPNIAAVYGLHEAEGLRFLAMEFVRGEDLEHRLRRGPLALQDALEVGAQVARALEAAHAQGVVHRDLKPANVVRAEDGTIKVLDFGLAKALTGGPASGGSDPSLSPTMTSIDTQAGMILGTAAYMSPEQARGRPTDARADLWAFGAVLMEMITGRQVFAGDTVSDILASVLKSEPDWDVLPAATPRPVRRLLRRCLRKDADTRLHHPADARIEIEAALSRPDPVEAAGAETAVAPAPAWKRALPWAVAAAAVLVSLWFALGADRTAIEETISRRLTIPVPGRTNFGDASSTTAPPAISPDGRFVVFGVESETGDTRLWLRPLNDFTARPLHGTEGAAFPFWSPDSRHIGYFRSGKLRRVEVATGSDQPIGGEGTSYPRGGSWNADGQIIFAPNANTGIHVIDAGGGEIRQITVPDPEIADGSHRWPWFLPDGEHFLFTLWTNDMAAQQQYGGVYVASLSGDEEPVRILPDPSSAAYSETGHLLVVRGDKLFAVPFDADARRITGEAVVVAGGVLRLRSNGHAAFSASTEGTLVYAGGEALEPFHLTWYDRVGNAVRAAGEPAAFLNLRLAPDATRAVAAIPGATGDGEIWILDLERGVRTRLAHGAVQYDYPVWSGDGEGSGWT